MRLLIFLIIIINFKATAISFSAGSRSSFSSARSISSPSSFSRTIPIRTSPITPPPKISISPKTNSDYKTIQTPMTYQKTTTYSPTTYSQPQSQSTFFNDYLWYMMIMNNFLYLNQDKCDNLSLINDVKNKDCQYHTDTQDSED